ncbi:MAG: thioredoxin domain-containing protein [Deltaproteobacteria bacterium]|nr:thioredoxin domain-containing protein [Deltaproteobacteria bacterium]
MKAHVQRYIAAGVLAALAWAPVALADDATNAKIIDYYRRKSNLPPEVTVTVTNITDSKIPGAKVATMNLSRGGQVQTQTILMSADGRYVVFGEVEDVTSDPFKAIAAKLKLQGAPVEGAKDAKVTIVEFSDFQCPYCSRAHTTIEQVMKEYDGKVKLVYKNYPLPFHKWAEPAGIASACAFKQDPAAFWKMYDFFFNNQQQITPENVKDKALEALAGTKVDKAKWTTCYDNKETADIIKADMAEGQSVGVTGTPAFIINGRKISGAQPFQNFKAVIDDELSRAGKS